jgi:rod shape-determining protein MreD
MAASRIVLACASVATVLLLQASLVGPLTFPVPVSLPALFVIVVAIYLGPGVGIGLGFGAGLVADHGSENPAGVLALCWMASGLLAGMIGGLVTERGYRVRGVAFVAAAIAAATGCASMLVLAVLGSHAASFSLAFRDVIPVLLADALVGLALVPVVRGMLRRQGIRGPRPAAELVRYGYAAR